MSFNKENINHLDLYIRYLAKETDIKESNLVEEWLANEENKLFFQNQKDIWDRTDSDNDFTDIDSNDDWIELNKKINDHDDILSTPVIPIKKVSSYKFIFRIAAAVIFGIGLWSFLFNKNAINTIASENKIGISDTLPDGSVIYLNALTTIKYPHEFSDETREVQLIEGEAYFKVQHNKDKPFIISVLDSKIQVLGTEFSVVANTEKQSVEVVVNSGTVLFYKSKNNVTELNTDNVLTADERGCFNNTTGHLTKEKNTELNYNSWKTGYITFEEMEMSKAVSFLEKYYNVDIIIIDDNLSKCRLTAEFDNKSIDFILEVLETTFQIKVKKEGRIIKLFGAGC